MSSIIYKVFISSSFEDLIEERKQIIQKLLLNRFFPVGMEFFESSNARSVEFIKTAMTDCDYYILIIKGKYGSIEPKSGKSYTELEYELALKMKLDVLAFIYYDESELKMKEIETDVERRSKLEKFRTFLKTKHTTSSWDSIESLNSKIITSLNYLVENNPATGFSKRNPLEASKKSKIPFDEVKTQERKIAYHRFLHLTKKNTNEKKQAAYSRHIARVVEAVPIYDEWAFFQVNEFQQEVSDFEVSNVTTGVVDLTLLHPWQAELFFPEGASLEDLRSIKQTFRESAKTFISLSHFLNGFQNNQYLRTRMEKDTKKASLIVDFSYLVSGVDIIDAEKIEGTHEKDGVAKRIAICQNPAKPGNDTVSPAGVYWITAENLHKGDILKIDFEKAIKWDNIEIQE